MNIYKWKSKNYSGTEITKKKMEIIHKNIYLLMQN